MSRSGLLPVLTACCDKINAEACSAGTLSSDPSATERIDCNIFLVINGESVSKKKKTFARRDYGGRTGPERGRVFLLISEGGTGDAVQGSTARHSTV